MALRDIPTTVGRPRTISCATIPPKRKTQNVASFQTKVIKKGHRVLSHSCNRRRNFSGAACQTRGFEQDNFPAGSERIGNGGIPIVQCPGELLKEQQREARPLSETAIRVFSFLCRKELRRSARVAGCRFLPHFHCSPLFAIPN
jgi:hypothetical protein